MSTARVGSRLIRQTAIVVIGLAIGAGVVLAARGGDPRPVRAGHPPSVTRFDFFDGALPAVSDTSVAVADPAPTPAEEPATAEAAVALYLRSLSEGRPDASYSILDGPSRQRFPSAASWTRAQADLAVPTSFEIGPSRAAFGASEVVEVEVTATHRPSLDPVRGLVPGRSSALWQARREEGRWRVGAQPVSAVPVLPDEAGAAVAVSGWVDRLQACDATGAAGSQAGTYLYGPADFVRAPCEAKGAWTVGSPVGLDRTPDAKDYLAAFGPGVGSWTRLVPVDGPGSRFFAVVAPIGDAWQVLGVAVRG